MLRLAWQTVRGRMSGFAGSLVALSFALTLITACGVLMESALRATTPPERYAAAPVVVGGQPLIPHGTRLATALEKVPGVRAAVPDVSFPVTASDRSGAVLSARWGGPSLGHSWESARLAPFRLRAGRPPRAGGEVVLDSGLAAEARARVGDSIRLTTAERTRPYRVVGVGHPPRDPMRQFAVFFSAAETPKVAGTADPPVTAIGLLPRPGTDTARLARQVRTALAEQDTGDGALSDLVTATGGARADLEFRDVGSPGETLSSLVGTLGVISLAVAAFVTASTLALSVRQRLREIALLRVIAATPRQIRRLIAAETLLVTVAGAAIGTPLGILLASLLHRRLVHAGVLPPTLALHIGVVAPAVVLGLTALTAQLAVRGAARRASSVSPTDALRESSGPVRRIGRVRTVTGVIVVATGLVVLRATVQREGEDGGTAESMVLVLMVGVALLGPLIARMAGVLAAPLARLFPVGGFLAAANLRAEGHRLASAITPLALAVAFSCTVLSVPHLTAEGAERDTRQRVSADRTVGSAGAGLPARFAEDAARLPGVRAATGLLRTSLDVSRGPADSDPLVAARGVAVRPEALADTLDLDVRRGSLKELRGAAVALGATAARDTGAGPGSSLRVSWEDGTTATVRVVAVYARDRGFGDVLMSRSLAAPHAANPLDDSALVRSAPGTPPEHTARRLARLAQRYPTARVDDGAGRDADGGSGAGAASFGLLLIGLINVFAAIAMVNTLVMTTAHRAREFGLLRLAGAARAQVLGMAGWEGAVTAVVALVVGSTVSAAVLVPISLEATGSAVPAVPVGPVAAVLAVTALLGLVTVVLTARLALRHGTPPEP
ncbi:FtsX-like permease family protein [Streptomyces sp. HD1123-B1]|uniref:ABC transporter permease n=1 Tax=Streptomyces huangiella TaxID=3228804 RepID=UPI003D7D73F2